MMQHRLKKFVADQSCVFRRSLAFLLDQQVYSWATYLQW